MYDLETYHYLLLHFPIALFLIGYCFDSMNFIKKNSVYGQYGEINLKLGIGLGVVTIISGFITDNILVGHMSEPLPVLTTHGTHMIISILSFVGLYFIRSKNIKSQYYFYIHTILVIFFIHGVHIGAKLADRI